MVVYKTSVPIRQGYIGLLKGKRFGYAAFYFGVHEAVLGVYGGIWEESD